MRKQIIFILGIIFTFIGCNKYPEPIVKNSIKTIEQMNHLNLNEKQIFRLYNQFKSNYEIHLLKTLDTSNMQVDTAIWQFETSINTDYGFPFNIAHKVYDVYDTIEYSITGYTTDSIPIINGSELYNEYSAKVNDIQAENNNGDSTYFWCTNMNIYQIDKTREKVIVTTYTSYSQQYPNILPPGVYPDPFPHPTCINAVNPLTGYNAAKAFEQKYEIYGPQLNYTGTTPYIITLYQLIGYDHNDQGVGDKLWWHYYTPEDLCTNQNGTGKLNSYLFSTKDVIDEHNYSHDNIFLGNLNIYPCYLPGNYYQWEHIVEMYFYYIHYESSTN